MLQTGRLVPAIGFDLDLGLRLRHAGRCRSVARPARVLDVGMTGMSRIDRWGSQFELSMPLH